MQGGTRQLEMPVLVIRLVGWARGGRTAILWSGAGEGDSAEPLSHGEEGWEQGSLADGAL